jgi:6-phosphogluconolactonase
MCPEHPRAAENYEALIRQEVRANPQGIPRFDLLLLGMGADGHTASLFPGTRALEERTRLVVLNDVPQLHTQRVTMTFPLINAAKNRWFLVRGPDKAHAFQQAQQGIVPAGRILSPTWFIDPTAAAKPE